MISFYKTEGHFNRKELAFSQRMTFDSWNRKYQQIVGGIFEKSFAGLSAQAPSLPKATAGL